MVRVGMSMIAFREAASFKARDIWLSLRPETISSALARDTFKETIFDTRWSYSLLFGIFKHSFN